ncbi:hypothetical protein C7E18_00405 [Stenotrophomonas maltophilia]|nr:hypothetical protein C7E18_00405 [Stenotrophomonas maltophilia]
MRTGWPPMVPGELLSSYLARSALTRGVSAQSLVALACPGRSAWNRDIDVSPSDCFLLELATAIGCDVDALMDMTLAGLMKGHLELEGPGGVRSWVNAVGIYHRCRTRYGLCYCPQCLEESAVFNAHWRLSYWTVCPAHGVVLCDSCPQCGAALEPHRQRVDLRRCARCHQLMTGQLATLAAPTHTQTALTAASLMSQVPRYWPCAATSGSDYARGMHMLLSAFHDARGVDFCCTGRMRDRIELRRVRERHLDMQLLDELVRLWPYSMLSIAERYHLTQRSFRGECPHWLWQAVRHLPPGRVNGLGAPSLARVRAARSAQLARRAGWRTMRAQILIEMAGQ